MSLPNIENFTFPEMSSSEQEVLNQIEPILSVVNQLEQTIKEKLQKAETLRQSILKKAFGGGLVKE